MAAWGDSALGDSSKGDGLSTHERAFFDSCFRELDTAGTNSIPAAAAAPYFRTSGLSDAQLAQIWGLAVGGKAALDRQAFFVALKLIALAQSGREVSLAGLSVQTPMPQFKGSRASASGPSGVVGGAGDWAITPQEKENYDKVFLSSGAVNGFLSADKAKGVLVNSKLPVEILKAIWELSDIDKDGQLDADEFAVAMYLTMAARNGRNPPAALPASLLPPSKRRGSSVASGSAPALARTSSASVTAVPVSAAKAAWVVTDAEKANFDNFFREADKDKDGFLTGPEAREIFVKSNLPQQMLAHIWTLADVERAGRLNAESFALAMHLITAKLTRGQDPPASLTPEMVPPFFRSNPSAAALIGAAGASVGGGVSPVALGSPALSPLGSASQPLTAAKRPSTQTLIADILRDKPPAPSDAGGDFTAIKELDEVSKEIDAISKEKETAEKETAELEQQVAQAKNETADLKAKADQAAAELAALQAKKQDAQRRLAEVEQEKVNADHQLTTIREQFDAETAEINSLKARIEQQQQSMRQQEESVRRTNADLEALREEETKLRAELEKGRRDLEALQKQQHQAQAEMDAMKAKIEQVNDARKQLEQQTTPQAIAAVAKASISSLDDVFSSSGTSTPARFSTVNNDPFAKSDPFLDDPFASSKAGGDDVFKSAGAGDDPFKSSSTDAFAFKANDDPFANADPFKSAGGDDPFKSAGDDPFGSGSGAKAGGDPFGGGGDDPFKSTAAHDPFASGATNGFSSDPFGSGVQRSDSVRSSGSAVSAKASTADPFAEDPFGGSKPAAADPFGAKPAAADPFGAAKPAATSSSVFGSDPFKSDDPFGAKGGFGDFETSFPETI